MATEDFTDDEREWAKRYIAVTNGETTTNPGKAPSLEILCHTLVHEIRKIKLESNRRTNK